MQTKTIPRDLQKQVKLVHKVVGVIGRSNRKTFDSAAALCGKARGFICQSSFFLQEGRRKRILRKGLCEIKT